MPELKDLKICQLCERTVEEAFLSDHHLIPKSRGGKITETICLDCHRQIHAIYSNKQLEEEFNNIEAFLADSNFIKFLKWIRKRPIGITERALRARDSRKRGRSG